MCQALAGAAVVNNTDQTPCQHGVHSLWESQKQDDVNRDDGLRMKTEAEKG